VRVAVFDSASELELDIIAAGINSGSLSLSYVILSSS